MRPIRLELEGFTSFRQKAELDFSSLELFAITGPTGAGKTSLIDALVYGLYGRTPRIGEKSASESHQPGRRASHRCPGVLCRQAQLPTSEDPEERQLREASSRKTNGAGKLGATVR